MTLLSHQQHPVSSILVICCGHTLVAYSCEEPRSQLSIIHLLAVAFSTFLAPSYLTAVVQSHV